ncbi:hypothetical protein B0T17DRAFT_504934 [Bombardia bombarda]|uniref:RanBP2-type domain-containing protein n=1 Tax=Bombardia bombarda TaxID=252184 RepID=A0AA40C7C2_9PEZI|nr:hypothetical protein B0T17DRAFT_504934 [Bombardia bombarda]
MALTIAVYTRKLFHKVCRRFSSPTLTTPPSEYVEYEQIIDEYYAAAQSNSPSLNNSPSSIYPSVFNSDDETEYDGSEDSYDSITALLEDYHHFSSQLPSGAHFKKVARSLAIPTSKAQQATITFQSAHADPVRQPLRAKQYLYYHTKDQLGYRHLSDKLRKAASQTTPLTGSDNDQDWECCDCAMANSKYEFLCSRCQAHTKKVCCSKVSAWDADICVQDGGVVAVEPGMKGATQQPEAVFMGALAPRLLAASCQWQGGNVVRLAIVEPCTVLCKGVAVCWDAASLNTIPWEPGDQPARDSPFETSLTSKSQNPEEKGERGE